VVIKSVLECKQTRERRGGRVVIGQGVYTPNGHTQGMHGVYTGMHGHACVALLRAGHHVHSLHHWVRCQTFSTLPAGDRSLLPACCCSMSDHPCRLLAAARSLDHPCRLLAAARSSVEARKCGGEDMCKKSALVGFRTISSSSSLLDDGWLMADG